MTGQMVITNVRRWVVSTYQTLMIVVLGTHIPQRTIGSDWKDQGDDELWGTFVHSISPDSRTKDPLP